MQGHEANHSDKLTAHRLKIQGATHYKHVTLFILQKAFSLRSLASHVSHFHFSLNPPPPPTLNGRFTFQYLWCRAGWGGG